MANLTIGSYLKDLRLKKGYSLERLSLETKISLSILKKLENNELATLPNVTYIKGYVQNIHKTLLVHFGKNEMDIINNTYIELKLTKPTLENSTQNIVETTNLDKNNNSNENISQGNIYNIESLKSKRIIFSIIIIITFIGVFRFIQRVNQQPELRQAQLKSQPVIKISDGQPTATEHIAVAVNPSQPTPTSIPINISTLQPTMTPTASVATYPQFEFKKITNLAVTIDTQSKDNQDFEIYTEAERKNIVTGKENIFVKKLDGESWISYKKNKESAKSILLKSGENFSLTADKIFLTIGNTAGVKIYYNGQLVSFVDTKGVKSFIFPLADATQHSLPLFVRDAKNKLYFYEDYIPLMNQESNAASEASIIKP